MTVKTKIAGMMTALMVLSVPMVYADNGPGPGDNAGWHQDGGWRHKHGDHMFAKILGLSDDQVKQLKGIHKKQRETVRGLLKQIKSTREALDAEIIKASPDMNKVNDLEGQLKGLVPQMVDARLNSTLEIKKIMTPEQFAGYMTLKKEMQMKKRMMRHHHDGFGPGFDGHKPWGKDGKDHFDEGMGD